VTFSATVAANSVNGGYNGHATIDSLKKHTAYSYRVGTEGGWSPTYSLSHVRPPSSAHSRACGVSTTA
jgi:hypothetical protein